MDTNRMSRRSFTISAGAFAALVAGMRTSVSAENAAQDADLPEILIEAMEYHFTMPAESDAGFHRLVMENTGATDHHAIFFRINDDATPEEFETALMSGDFAAVIAVTKAYGGPSAMPGGRGAVVANLDPGMYMVVCLIPDDDGVPHAAHGMVAPLSVSETVVEGEAPAADASISLLDFSFDGFPETVPAGMNVWEVTNNGEQLHELFVLQLADGITTDALVEMLTSESPEATPGADDGAEDGPPPVIPVAGVAPMSPEIVNYFELELEAGTYAAVCFVPDVVSGAPHIMLGMIAEFEVA